MSTFQSPFYSPQAQPAHSTPTKISFTQPSINASKIQQNIERKSPKKSKEKKSPSKKSSLKIQNDPKLNGVFISDKDNDHMQGTLTSKKDTRKNHQSLKDDKPKLSVIPENKMSFDNRIENKIRKSDHQIIFSNYETGVPYKQKSHSVKSVSVPQELLLLSPPGYDPAFLEAVNRKLETMKHVNKNDIDQQTIHSTNLLSLSNKQNEESKGNKYFSHNNTAGDHHTIWPDSKSKQKNSLPKSPQGLDTNPYSINKVSQPHSRDPRAENDGQPPSHNYNTSALEKPTQTPKIKTPEGSPPSKSQKEVKKKAPVKFSPRVSDPTRILSGQGHSKTSQSQRASHQEGGHKFSNNYMLEPPKSVKKPVDDGSFEAIESAKDNHNTSKSPTRDKSPLSSTKKTLTKESERNRTNSMLDQAPGMITHETNIDSKTSENIRSSKYTDPSTFSNTNAYTNSVNDRRNKRASDSQVREYDSLHSFKDNFILSTRSAIGGRQENYHGVNAHTEGNETFNDPEANVPVTKSVKFNKDSLQFQTQQKTDQIVSDLLKANTLRELNVNPNAKFLQLRKQVHDKRSKLAFKSVDFNAGEQTQFPQSETHQASPIREHSISPALSPILSASHEMKRSYQKESKSVESATLFTLESITKEQLFLLFNKTKTVLTKYKDREKDWDKERKMFITEIKRLRELAMKGLK